MTKIAPFARLAAPIARDGIGIAGAGSIVAGVAAWSEPAAAIVAGSMLLATAWLLARRG